MSTGLLFHYFESKEDLVIELVKMGAEYANKSADEGDLDPDKYFNNLLGFLFTNLKSYPMIYYMFVLMGQARRKGVMPDEAREIALSVKQIEVSAKLIEEGQKRGTFREGDPLLLATCFWTAVQGVMEEMAYDENMPVPNPEWIIAIIKK